MFIKIRSFDIQAIQLGQLRIMRFRSRASPPITTAQRTDNSDEVGIAHTLKVAGCQCARLRVTLIADHFDKVIRQLRHIHQLGPRPLETRAEHREHRAHATLATRKVERLHCAHLRPTQARTICDCGVEFFGRCDTILEKPQSFTPEGFLKTI